MTPQSPQSTISRREAIRKHLPEAFVRLLAEMAFADTWHLGSPEEAAVALAASTTTCCIPFSGTEKGVVLMGADPATLTDIAAGYHSLPDDMVDDGTRLEFLAEAGAMLIREMGLLPEVSGYFVPGAPRLPVIGEIGSMWRDAGAFSGGFGCNGDGWMILSVRLDD